MSIPQVIAWALIVASLFGAVLFQLMATYSREKKRQALSMKYIEWAVCRVREVAK